MKTTEPFAKKQQRHADRRAAIVRHYGESQNMAKTAEAFGITRQRVEQILDKERAREPAVLE